MVEKASVAPSAVSDDFEPEGLDVVALTLYHHDLAGQAVDLVHRGRLTAVYGGYIPIIAVERLAESLRLSEDQKLALWRAYRRYAERIGKPLQEAEQQHFEEMGRGLLAAFPEMGPGADLSHLTPEVATVFRNIQLSYERKMHWLHRHPASMSGTSTASSGERASWQSEWAMVYEAAGFLSVLGESYVRMRRRVTNQAGGKLLSWDLEIELPAREAFITAIESMFTEEQMVIWQGEAHHLFELNSYVLNESRTVADGRASRAMGVLVDAHDRVDVWRIMEDATAPGAELEAWHVIRFGGEVDASDVVGKQIRSVWINTVHALAEIAREASSNRGNLLELQRLGDSGEQMSFQPWVAKVRRDRLYHTVVQGFIISMSSVLHKHLGPAVSASFVDRVRAERFPAMYQPDSVDLLVEALTALEDRDPVLHDFVWDAVRARAEEYVRERSAMRAELADLAYLANVELRGQSGTAWFVTLSVMVKWMEAEIAARDEILKLIDDSGTVAAIRTVLARDGRTRSLEEQLAYARQRRDARDDERSGR